jgi:hypothetical protein
MAKVLSIPRPLEPELAIRQLDRHHALDHLLLGRRCAGLVPDDDTAGAVSTYPYAVLVEDVGTEDALRRGRRLQRRADGQGSP